MERKNAFIDWINLLLAIALFISPWVFGFAFQFGGVAPILLT